MKTKKAQESESRKKPN